MGPEMMLSHNHDFWAQKLTLWVSFWAQKLSLWARDTLCVNLPSQAASNERIDKEQMTKLINKILMLGKMWTME